MMNSACGHQICELIVLLQRERRYTGEPSNDDYSHEPDAHCFIREHRQGEPRPHLDSSNVEDAVRFVERLKPESVRAEIERLSMLHAARSLAKFVSTEAGNRDALRARLSSAIEDTRRSGQDTSIAEAQLSRLYSLGILPR
jgi:hypothetical protein